jgi:hypothetical protein
VKHSRQAVGQKCVSCHDASYTNFLTEWTTGLEKEVVGAAQAVRRAEAALARERRGGGKNAPAENLLSQARAGLALIGSARPVHNPEGTQALLEGVRKKAEEALARAGQR